jgi:transmembrane sensor
MSDDADHRDSDRRENRKRDLISQEAAEWFARMKDPDVPFDDRQRFLRWLKQSQVHVAEYLRVASIDGNIRSAQLSIVLTGEDPSNVVPLFAGKNERPSRRVAGSLRWKIAAAIAVLAIATLLSLGVGTAWHERSLETQLGEWKTVSLADGSELQLGPNTRLTLDIGDTQRSIALLRGEAYFKVAKDATRPFSVQANAFAVVAVGTEFAVSRRNDELIVTVREGKVRVRPSSNSTTSRPSFDEPDELSVPIAADFQLRIAGGDTWPVTPSRIDVRYALAWREKQLMFKAGDTLADAVEEFNVRNRLQLRLDSRAGSLPVRGSFDASDPVAFAQTVDKTSPVAVQRLAADELLIKAE